MTTTTVHATRPEFEYEYRWDRILPAAAALLVGVGLLVWGGMAIFGGKSAEPEAPVVQSQQLTLPPPVITTNATTSTTANTAPAEIASARVEPPVTTPAVITPPAAATTPKPTAVTPQMQTTPAAPVANKVTPPAPAPAAQHAQAPAPVESKPKTDAAPELAALKPGQITGSGKVSLQQVLDQEPIDLKKGAIVIGQEKAVKVVFSGEGNKPGDVIHYRWYHNGKLVAKVRNTVSPDGQTHSSKFISYDTPGEWQVQMLNKNGKLLAETAFAAKTK